MTQETSLSEWVQQLKVLNDRLDSMEKKIGWAMRVAAKSWNVQQYGGGGKYTEYAEVPFLNGRLPSEEGLPPLVSIVEIRNLQGKNLERYYLGYHHLDDDEELPLAEDMREGVIKEMSVHYTLKGGRQPSQRVQQAGT